MDIIELELAGILRVGRCKMFKQNVLRQILATPASVERVFSVSGEATKGKRNCLVDSSTI